jgi:hypothetical protein
MNDDQKAQLRAEIEPLLLERLECQKQKGAAEKRGKELDEILIPLLYALDEKNANGNYATAFPTVAGTAVDGEHASIDRAALILEGVDTETIDKCTKRTPFTYVLPRAVKPKKGDDE